MLSVGLHDTAENVTYIVYQLALTDALNLKADYASGYRNLKCIIPVPESHMNASHEYHILSLLLQTKTIELHNNP